MHYYVVEFQAIFKKGVGGGGPKIVKLEIASHCSKIKSKVKNLKDENKAMLWKQKFLFYM